MTKQLEKTAEVIEALKTSLDNPDIDTSNWSVFEARMLSTEAISQKGFHDGARVSQSTLIEMAEYVNTKGTVVPLQTMHETRGNLPVGRVFQAAVRDMPNGEAELVGRFYIPSDGVDGEQTKLINNIEASLIDEVSVGLISKKVLCSECDFDYFSEDADLINIITMTCDNEHTIGENGTHIRLVGMDTFAELSLVGRGAAKNAKILSKANRSRSLSQETVERLAASKLPAEAYIFTASFKMDTPNSNQPNQGDQQMSNTLETTLASTSKALGKVELELAQATNIVTDLNNQITTLQESITAKDVEITDLKASVDVEITTLQATNTALETKLADASEVVLGDLKAALIATGEKEEDIPEDLSAMLSNIKEKGLKLHQLFGVDGTSKDVKTSREEDDNSSRQLLNFKVT